MKQLQTIKQWRYSVFSGNGLALLSFLGILVGITTSLVIGWFMVSIDVVLALFQTGDKVGFSGFTSVERFFLPLLGALLLIVLFRLTPKNFHDVGIVHVIDRLQRGRAKIPIGNVIFQFFAALTVLTSGFSMGKEGPAVHVGSGIGSKVGREVHRSPSQLRLLTGCGTAAAISSAFGTPLAGVMFAMEVVLMEYSLSGFIPIVAASVAAAIASQLIFSGHYTAFSIDVVFSGNFDAHWVILAGVFTGIIAALVHRLVKLFLGLQHQRRESRFLLAGLITGALGFFLPQILGLGYESMNDMLAGQYAWPLLVAILIAKIIATSAAVGLGIPAGIVAPSLFIGMAAGGLIGFLVPGIGNDAFYSLIGMAGVMSALLHAPLAALTAVLELSVSAEIMLPAMIVVVLSNLTCQVLFQQPSIFQTLLASRGLNITTHPMRHALASRYLTEVASENFSVVRFDMDEAQVNVALSTGKKLTVFRTSKASHLLTTQSLLARFESWMSLEKKDKVDLTAYLAQVIPERSRVAILDSDISLLEAIRLLHSEDVVGLQVPLDDFRIGLVSRSKLTSVLTAAEGDLH